MGLKINTPGGPVKPKKGKTFPPKPKKKLGK